MKAIKILFTGGGSGGPTTPLLALHESLSNTSTLPIIAQFWGTRSGPEKQMVERTTMSYHAIPAGKLRRYWSVQNFIDPFWILLACFLSFFKLLAFRPQIVVSAGSFVSVPVAYACWILRIPHVIYQMDIRPGLANRLMAPVSSQLLYLFDDTRQGFPSSLSKQKIGPIVRSEIVEGDAEKANQTFSLTPDKPVLLVTGGGQGSVGINQAVSRLLPLWLEDFQVVHLTGNQHEVTPFDDVNYHPIAFVNTGMGDLLARSNLVISRAGLGIISELATLEKNALLIPLPNTHQEENVHLLLKQNACFSISQDTFESTNTDWWKEVLANYQTTEVGKNLHHFLPSGGTQVATNLLLTMVLKGDMEA